MRPPAYLARAHVLEPFGWLIRVNRKTTPKLSTLLAWARYRVRQACTYLEIAYGTRPNRARALALEELFPTSEIVNPTPPWTGEGMVFRTILNPTWHISACPRMLPQEYRHHPHLTRDTIHEDARSRRGNIFTRYTILSADGLAICRGIDGLKVANVIRALESRWGLNAWPELAQVTAALAGPRPDLDLHRVIRGCR